MSGNDPLGYYSCLDVPTDATSSQIKAAYKARAKETHPDANVGRDTASEFIEVQKAYDVLSDAKKREQYDAVGFADAFGFVGESEEPQHIEPVRCTKCGVISAQPRFRVNYFVIGFAYWSYKKPVSGVYCERCDVRQSLLATGFDLLLGWWGLVSFFWNFHALYTHLKDHVSIGDDAILQGHQVFYFVQEGNHKLASAIANESLQIIDTALKAGDFSSADQRKYLESLKFNIDKYLISQPYENRSCKIKKRAGINSPKFKWQLAEIAVFMLMSIYIVFLLHNYDYATEQCRIFSSGIFSARKLVAQDYSAAASWCHKAADLGNAAAQTDLGHMYYMGKGVPQDFTAAASWYRKAADQGDAQAQNMLGFMYANGEGVARDYAAAVGWYRKAADQENAAAQYNLAAMYDNGEGVARDHAEAVSWYRKAADQYRKAADQGYANAQNSLGAMYHKGVGVAQDYAAAVKWYRKAADQGEAKAQNNLCSMYREGKGVAQDYAAAVSWCRKAADQGDAPAQYMLGGMYYKGVGVAQDYAAAASWCRKAADQGYANAQNSLGVMYHKGVGVAQDDAAAVNWFRKAADKGYAAARRNLGIEYHEGKGVAQDDAAAVIWYRQAADQGDATAQYMLGAMYQDGKGVTQDYVQALKWFNLAATSGYADARKYRDIAASKMTPAQVAEAQRLSNAWRAR